MLALGLVELHAQAPVVPARELVVATKAAPPFAMSIRTGAEGVSALRYGRRSRIGSICVSGLVETQSVPDLLDGVANGTFDAGVAAVTVTAARAHSVDFTQPFYNTGLGVAVPINENPWVSIGGALFSFGFFQTVGAALFRNGSRLSHMGAGATQDGTLWWRRERIRLQLWWSTIAMTQAGAAHNALATLPGRIVAMGWMIAIAVFTAGITSTLTRRGLEGAVHSFKDLRSVRVGSVVNSVTTDYFDRQRLSFQTFPDIQSGLSALEAGKIDAFVHDKPLLTWMVRNDFSSTVRVVDTSFNSESYAIVLPKNSALRPMLDLAVLDQVESDWWQQALFETLGMARSP